jgi:UPF0716 protein FxsA
MLLLIVVPLVELVLVLTLADVMGFTATLAIVIVTGLLGAWLLRRQGWRTLTRIRTELGGGRLPPNEILDGVLILMAGALLLTPGVLTDLAGIALLIPWTRAVFRGWLIQYVSRRWRLRTAGTPHTEIIDSYVVSRDEPDK